MSSDNESDADFVPGEPEQLSEEESANEETDLQYENEQEKKAVKRKAVLDTKGNKKCKTKHSIAKDIEEDKSEEDNKIEELDPEAEKKREEDLWAKFLDGTDTKPKEPTKTTEPVKPVEVKEKPSRDIQTGVKKNKEDEKARERRIFEFAGETIVVEDNVIKEKIKTDNPETILKLDSGPSRSRGGGLSSVIGQLNKKSKLSTLEKSKLDWVTFKKQEGIEEEIASHNKGKHGYLERQDFLERADVRQFEIERELRTSRRSNR